MKKFLAMLLAVVMIFSLAACKSESGNDNTVTEAPVSSGDTKVTEAPAATEAPVADADIFAKSEGVMTYAEYAAAELDSQVTIETFVQAKQSWWDNKGTFYTQDNEGGYFLYNMPCSEDEYNLLVPGTKIKVTGYKSAWSGEVEIVDATYEIEEGSYIAEAVDMTSALGSDALIDSQNLFVSFKGMTVEAQADGSAFLYNWDGSGSHDSNSDLYFTLSKGGESYSFTVESYLCYNYTDVYAAVESLHVGDVIDVEGFLYWYNGSQPHVTGVTVTSSEKSEGVIGYAEYAAAAVDTPVVIETYVQAKQSWWNDTATVYTQDREGGYFIYNMTCSESDYAKLVPGTKIKVTGYKSEWSGEYEIADATFEIEDGSYIAEATDVTAFLASEDLISYQNRFVTIKGLTVAPSTDADGNEAAFLYKWNGSGQDGDDLYFNVSLDGATYTFTVESYLCDNTTDVYAAVKNLSVGDVIDIEGFLYWYNGVQPHVTAVIK